MAQQDTGQERTEQATPKKLQDARKKGQIARSRELSTMLVLMTSASVLMLSGEEMSQQLATIMRRLFTIDPRQAVTPVYMVQSFIKAIEDALLAVLPVMGAIFLVSLVAPLVMGGWNFSTESLGFKLEKINPGKGIKRIFSVNSLMELGKALGKFLIVFSVAILIIWMDSSSVIRLGIGSELTGITEAMKLLILSFLLISAATILIALVDVPFQLWSHANKLKMTRQEVKDEMKETDGNPEIKRRVREAQQEIAGRRMMEAVPGADVVIVNPTHFSAALKYDQSSDGAPILVASGKGHLALKIKELAREKGVPVVSSPALARSLYRFGTLNHEIPAGLFVAVAQVLAFVFQIRRQPGWQGYASQRFRNLDVPDDLRYDPDGGTSVPS